MASTKRSISNPPLSKLRNDTTEDQTNPKTPLSSTTAAIKNLLGFSEKSSSGELPSKSKQSNDFRKKGSADSYKTNAPSDLRKRAFQRPSPVGKTMSVESSTISTRFESSEDRLNSADSLDIYRNGEQSLRPSYCQKHFEELSDNWMPNSITDFSIYKILGKGAFSKVYLCKRKADGKIFALKSMRKDLIIKLKQVHHVHDEKLLLRAAVSPFITKFYYALQDSVHLFMIIEYVGGG